MMIRCLVVLSGLAALAGCSSSGDGNAAPPVDSECSVAAQLDTTLEIARAWYLWNDLLPGNINPGDFDSVGELLLFLMEFSPTGSDGFPVDRFSSIGPAAADQQFFGEGRFEGFGFGYRFEADNSMFVTRVYADSPAAGATLPLARGQRILGLNGSLVTDIIALEGFGGLFDILESSPVTFTIRPLEGADFDTTISRGIVTIDPVPQWRLIERDGLPPVGFIEFSQFISTADAELEAVFEQFRLANVSDVIVDLRYNGGGLVTTAELFGDYLGGFVATNLVFTETRFNADRANQNSIRRFNLLLNSINLSRLVVVASGSTASASEMIINGMDPHVEVAIVGDSTFGKPIGQAGFEFCDNILRLTAFELLNADGIGDYFDGLPVTPGCSAPDDLSAPVGAGDDPNMVKALGYLDTGACPAAALAGGQQKPSREAPQPAARPDASPARIYGNSL